MLHTSVSFLWENTRAERGFGSAVCLHGHTMHSEECLSFLPRYSHRLPVVSQVMGGYQARGVDFERAYWTPPLTPASAFHLEQGQIAGIGLRPMVSLTDHDKIEANLALRVMASGSEAPISVEWTVPYERSILHLGIHNLPAATSRIWMARLAACTAAPEESCLRGLLADLAAMPETLVVLNHPYWLEEGVQKADHAKALERYLRECGEWTHALELNGTREWNENARVVELAHAVSCPLISGGDRHGNEPSAVLNLTNAASFGDFVREVREGYSQVLFLPQYREPMPLRIMETAWDVLRRYPEYPGREHWTDRVFYRGEDGIARPVGEIWSNRVPLAVRPLMGFVRLCAKRTVRPALRYLLMRRAEAAL